MEPLGTPLNQKKRKPLNPSIPQTLRPGNPHKPDTPKPLQPYSRSPKVGNPIASILKSNVYGIPALIVLNPVFNFLGSTISPYNPKPSSDSAILAALKATAHFTESGAGSSTEFQTFCRLWGFGWVGFTGLGVWAFRVYVMGLGVYGLWVWVFRVWGFWGFGFGGLVV